MLKRLEFSAMQYGKFMNTHIDSFTSIVYEVGHRLVLGFNGLQLQAMHHV